MRHKAIIKRSCNCQSRVTIGTIYENNKNHKEKRIEELNIKQTANKNDLSKLQYNTRCFFIMIIIHFTIKKYMRYKKKNNVHKIGL